LVLAAKQSTNGSRAKGCPVIASAATGSSKRMKSIPGLNPARQEAIIYEKL